MQTLFADDMKSLDYSWMIERVHRATSKYGIFAIRFFRWTEAWFLILVLLRKKQRDLLAKRAIALNINPEIHYLDASPAVRKERVARRNAEKDPKVCVFDVTDVMFDFMESRFEPPDEKELENGLRVSA